MNKLRRNTSSLEALRLNPPLKVLFELLRQPFKSGFGHPLVGM
ncbi:hypothetical protein AB4114_08185 [Paenibacillus sp. 2RAB27]